MSTTLERRSEKKKRCGEEIDKTTGFEEGENG